MDIAARPRFFEGKHQEEAAENREIVRGQVGDDGDLAQNGQWWRLTGTEAGITLVAVW